MSKAEAKRFDTPDEVRPFTGHGHVDLVQLTTGDVGLGTFEPGWKWSNDVKPIAGTQNCQVGHVGYCLSGADVRAHGGRHHHRTHARHRIPYTAGPRRLDRGR